MKIDPYQILEPAAVADGNPYLMTETQTDNNYRVQLSIAISLKRIADALEEKSS